MQISAELVEVNKRTKYTKAPYQHFTFMGDLTLASYPKDCIDFVTKTVLGQLLGDFVNAIRPFNTPQK